MSSQNRKPRKKVRSRKRSLSSDGSVARSASSQRTYTSQVCNLIFPVPRVKQMLKVHNYAGRVSDKSAVFLTAVMEYITTEILELSTNAARSEGGSRIHPRHVNRAIKTDREFLINFRNTSVAMGGRVPPPEEEETEENESRPSTRKQPKPAIKPVATKRNKSVKRRSSRKKK